MFAGNRGGFDAIVGNPPYINIRLLTQARGEAIKRYFRGRYQCAYRGYDVFVLFLEKAFELLRPGGACGMIVPNKLASLDYALPCRSLLLEQTTLRQITDVADLKIFPDAGVYPYIVIWQKQLADVDHCVAVSRPRTPRDLAAPRKPATVRQKSLSAAAGFHLHGRLDVEARVATRPLGQCCSLHSGTSGFVAQRLAGDLLEHDQAGDRPCFEFVVSGNIDRYRVRTGRVRYMKRSYARPVLPIGCEQLSARKARLFREPKIVIAGMTRRLEAALDPGGLALGVQVYAAADPQEDPRFLLGLLNSKLLSYLFRIRFQAKRLSGGYLAINKGQLTRLPIRLVVEGESRELAWREAVIGAVQRMAELQAAGDAGDDAATHEKRVAEFHRVDRQLDRLVYQLYAVSDDEAAVIEQEIEA